MRELHELVAYQRSARTSMTPSAHYRAVAEFSIAEVLPVSTVWKVVTALVGEGPSDEIVEVVYSVDSLQPAK
jgi:hypothetical protein